MQLLPFSMLMSENFFFFSSKVSAFRAGMNMPGKVVFVLRRLFVDIKYS